MLDRIEREEREERELMKGLTSSARSDSSFGSVSGCWSEASSASNSTVRTLFRRTSTCRVADVRRRTGHRLVIDLLDLRNCYLKI